MLKMKWSLCLLVVLFSMLVSGCSGEESSHESGENDETGAAEEESSHESGEHDETETSWEEVPIMEIDLLDGAISISLPEGFSSMEDELIVAGYEREDIPDEIFMNTDATANIAFKHDDLVLPPDEVDDYVEAMTDLLNSSDTLILLSSGVNELDGQDVGYFNIVTEQEGRQIYNSIWVTSLDGTALYGSFNCYDVVAAEMKPIAVDVYKSIQFN